MKIIIKNIYVELFKFESSREFSSFKNNQLVPKKLELNELSGNVYYCYIGHDSLTKEKIFSISFCSYQQEKDLSFLVWYEDNLIVLNTGSYIYLIDYKIHVVKSFQALTPLIGLYITKGNNLLILEEASARIVNSHGQILKNELFDQIEDFSIEGNNLLLKINGESRKIVLL